MAAAQESLENSLTLLSRSSVGVHWSLVAVYCLSAALSLCRGEIICQCTNSSCKIDAELTLSRRVFKTGTNLTASCTLLDAAGQHCNFTARDIFFKYLGKKIDERFVTVLNKTTATLNIAGLKRADSGAHMYCLVDGYVNRLSTGVQLPMNVGQAVIKIADRPQKPRFTGCVVYNWLSMNCTWKPATQDTGIKTKQSLFWTVLPGQQLDYCPVQQDGSCVWPSVEDVTHSVQSYRRDFVYYLTIKAENDLGNLSSHVSVPTRYKEDPRAIFFAQLLQQPPVDGSTLTVLFRTALCQI
ncbi:hypothetical protein LSH36_196g04062 [Paralvinella palmiformis]|uniref:Ig-like domain-containing protein n=1 Tax=Paralvinella palmiformis TaxID=53620 RepID=A0AAD9N564_9ANNE|nr:hypothetical protein LSH36_196g04062 [Paralvinella palmiformis]